ncbi:MAG TPA: hypothetical protein DCF33_02695 [Saprospirales bacterium]|nr:hypothetical protein [Saprospirales bacterium]
MEQNRENLQQAIRQLPEYQPPAGLWDTIAGELDFDQTLEKPLQELPVYTPPADLWDSLAARIEQAPELAPEKGIRPAYKWLVGLVLMALGVWVFLPVAPPVAPASIPTTPAQSAEPIALNNQPQQIRTTQTNNTQKKAVKPTSKPRLAHRTEVVDDALIMACRSAEDPNYDLVETLCKEALPVCEEPQFKQLKAEFDDLTQAHTALKNALGQYADDPDLVSQLIDIEQARDQVLQQLMAMM